MATMTRYTPAVDAATARDGFGQILLAEWTKFRSVRGTAWSLIVMVLLLAGMSMFGATASSTSSSCPCTIDQGFFVHQQLAGDGAIVARVATQQDTGTSPRAGVMIRDSLEEGSAFVSIGLVPGQGVRMQANYGADTAGSTGTAPRWLRLTRTGNSVTGSESTDGQTWTDVATVDASALVGGAEIGMFVTSPGRPQLIRVAGGTQGGEAYTPSTATFDSVTATGPAGPLPARWANDNRSPTENLDRTPVITSATQAAGVFTVTGAGDIVIQAPGGDDDIVRNSLGGVLFALMAAAVLGVVFITSEYAKGTIRTTFTASPRRRRVLAAKAVVVGGATFTAALVASVAAFLLAQPILHGNGYRPPAYPYASLTDGATLRAVVGTAGFLAVLALFGLGLGTLLRRAAGAITLVIVSALVPMIIAPLLPLGPAVWLQRLTPAAGLAIQITRDRYDNPINPWAGFGVLCAYAAVALGLALWQLRRRDA